MSDFIIQDLLPGSSLRLYCLKAAVEDSALVERYKSKYQRSTILLMFLPQVDQLMQINMKPQYKWQGSNRK